MTGALVRLPHLHTMKRKVSRALESTHGGHFCPPDRSLWSHPGHCQSASRTVLKTNAYRALSRCRPWLVGQMWTVCIRPSQVMQFRYRKTKGSAQGHGASEQETSLSLLDPRACTLTATSWYLRVPGHCPAPQFPFNSIKANSALVLDFRLSSDLEDPRLPGLRVMGESSLGLRSFYEAHNVHRRKRPREDALLHTWAVGVGSPSKRPRRGGPVRKGTSPPTRGRGHLPGSVSPGWAEKPEDGRKGSPVRGLPPPLTGRVSRVKRGSAQKYRVCGAEHGIPREL